MNIQPKNRALLLVVGLAAWGSGLAAEQDSPEVALYQARTQIKNILAQVKAIHEINNQEKLAPVVLSAERSYKNAEVFFKKKFFVGVVRELNRYLNLLQNVDPQKYFRAQYMLGFSYKELGYLDKSARAFRRYLASFITADEKNYSELNDVMRALLQVEAQSPKRHHNETRVLFSSILSLEVPESNKVEVLLLVAHYARQLGLLSLAEGWLVEAEKKAGQNVLLRSQARYYRGIAAVQLKDYERARQLFDLIIKETDSDAGVAEYKNFALLARARLAVQEKKSQEALKFYGKVSRDSQAFRDALFEHIFVAIDAKQHKQAYDLAKEFVERYHQGADVYQIKTLLAYLSLHANQTNDAKSYIDQTKLQLTQLAKWLGRFRLTAVEDGQVSFDELMELTNQTSGLIKHSSVVNKAHEMFNQIFEIKRRLLDQRSNIQNLIFTLGDMPLKQLYPQHIRRSQQLNELSQHLLEQGLLIVGAMRQIINDQLQEAEKLEFDALERRRLYLFSQVAELRRYRQKWTSWYNASRLSWEASQQMKRVEQAAAALASVKYLSRKETMDKGFNEQALEKKYQELQRQLSRSLEVSYRLRIKSLQHQSPHKRSMQFHLEYSDILQQQAQLLKGVFDRGGHQLITSDVESAWKLWEQGSKALYDEFNRIDQELKNQLTSLVEDIDRKLEVFDQLDTELDLRHQAVATYLGKIFPVWITYYVDAISGRLSQLDKWKSDITWIEYQGNQQELATKEKKSAIQKKILTESLKDLQYGVLQP